MRSVFQVTPDLNWDTLFSSLKFPFIREESYGKESEPYWRFVHERDGDIKEVPVYITGYPKGCPSEIYYNYCDMPHLTVWFFTPTSRKAQADYAEQVDYAKNVYEETRRVLAGTTGVSVIGP